MTLRRRTREAADVLVGKFLDAKLSQKSSLYPWQINASESLVTPGDSAGGPANDDARLADLELRYGRFDPTVTTPFVWVNGKVSAEDLSRYRGDNQYVWQRGGLNGNDLAYALSYYYLKSGTGADLLRKMNEDGAFGALTIEVDGRLVSRDLLDSVGEIDFLRRHVGLGEKPLSVLDVGAGYGRLAYRMTETVEAFVYATDAFATSTFLCEHYLAHRNSSAVTVPLDEVDDFLGSTNVDIATNIHSFSECRIEAVEWWIGRLAKAGVRYLMVVPNSVASTGEPRCLTNDRQDMEAVFEAAGYSLVAREPRHRDPLVQRFGLDAAQFNLFQLR
ncbi:MAG TPA: putative sugar O-methyltransferase [Novosphingobium sp.]|nr:putative sugar O-methyltransferase [Novosphingobium sp.]